MQHTILGFHLVGNLLGLRGGKKHSVGTEQAIHITFGADVLQLTGNAIAEARRDILPQAVVTLRFIRANRRNLRRYVPSIK